MAFLSWLTMFYRVVLEMADVLHIRVFSEKSRDARPSGFPREAVWTGHFSLRNAPQITCTFRNASESLFGLLQC